MLHLKQKNFCKHDTGYIRVKNTQRFRYTLPINFDMLYNVYEQLVEKYTESSNFYMLHNFHVG